MCHFFIEPVLAGVGRFSSNLFREISPHSWPKLSVFEQLNHIALLYDGLPSRLSVYILVNPFNDLSRR